MDGVGSVLKVWQAELVDGLRVGGGEGESRMTPRFLAVLLGRWWCHLQRWETGGGRGRAFKLRRAIKLLCQHHPPGQGLGDWLGAAHPEKWAQHSGDPSWVKK